MRLPDGTTGYVSKAWTDASANEQISASSIVGPPVYEIDAVDVGTGLALVISGADFTIVYDGGSQDDRATGADNRLIAYLKLTRPNLQRIDHVVLSHPHRDHMELLPDLIRTYQVGDVWDSGRLNDTCGYRAFLEAVAARPATAYHNALGSNDQFDARFLKEGCAGSVSVKRGAAIPAAPVRLGVGAQMTILSVDGSAGGSPNKNSMIVRVDLGSRRLLLVGDAEAGGREKPSEAPLPGSVEGHLLDCCRAALAADILVAGHHGSMTSSRSDFLDAVKAKTFVISSGPTSYGDGIVLPDPVVRDELDRRSRGGGGLWRTDFDDKACRINPHKVGNDNDKKVGGCDNVRILIDGAGGMAADYQRIGE